MWAGRGCGAEVCGLGGGCGAEVRERGGGVVLKCVGGEGVW